MVSVHAEREYVRIQYSSQSSFTLSASSHSPPILCDAIEPCLREVIVGPDRSFDVWLDREIAKSDIRHYSPIVAQLENEGELMLHPESPPQPRWVLDHLRSLGNPLSVCRMLIVSSMIVPLFVGIIAIRSSV